MKKIGVLHLITSMNMGGGARGVRTFYHYTQDALSNHVVCYQKKGQKYDEFSKTCPTLNFANGSQSFVKDYITKHHIGIIHLYGRGVLEDFEKELLTDLKGRVKVVYTNIFGEFDPASDPLINLYLFKSKHALTRIFAPHAGTQISKNSDFYNRLRVLPNPVDIDYFQKIKPNAAQIRQFKKSLNISDDTFVIGKIGSRKAIEKWSDLLLYMFPLVLDRHPNTVMLLQGVPDSRRHWIKRFGDCIRILNETTDDAELAVMYGSLDIFTHASKIGEHSGNSLNEAMYWGKPVIVNLTPDKDNGQMEQVMPEVTGYFANDPAIYADHVSELLINQKKRQRFGQAAHNFVLQHNHPVKLADDLISCYEFLLTGRSSALSISQDEIIQYNKEYARLLEKNLSRGKGLPLTHKISKLNWKVRDYIDHNFR